MIITLSNEAIKLAEYNQNLARLDSLVKVLWQNGKRGYVYIRHTYARFLPQARLNKLDGN